MNADLKKKAEPYRLCPDDPAEGNACSTHTHTHTHTHTQLNPSFRTCGKWRQAIKLKLIPLKTKSQLNSILFTLMYMF